MKMPQAERQLPLCELARWQVCTLQAALQQLPLCVGNYISFMKSEVTCSLAGDLSRQASERSNPPSITQTDLPGWVVSPLYRTIFMNKNTPLQYFYLQHGGNAAEVVIFSEKAYQLGVVTKLSIAGCVLLLGLGTHTFG